MEGYPLSSRDNIRVSLYFSLRLQPLDNGPVKLLRMHFHEPVPGALDAFAAPAGLFKDGQPAPGMEHHRFFTI